MGKSVSAKATYNLRLASQIFSSPRMARETMRAIIKAQATGVSLFQVHGITLGRGKPPHP